MKKFLSAAILASAAIATLAPTVVQAQSSASPYTSATRYDAAGRAVGTIAPDPDGTGSGNGHLATRTTYDARGNVSKVETGELTSWQSDTVLPTNWTSFTVHTIAETSYDLSNRKIMDKVSGVDGGTVAVVSLTQYSYDALGRLECTAVRMNPDVYSSIETYDACTVGPEGTDQDDFGPDRITKTVYNAAGQVLQVRKAVGTPIEIADATYSYTLNGQIEQVIDANGNRAEMLYDGHDRQTEWVFPAKVRPTSFNSATQATALATAGALSTDDGNSSTDDKEAYDYDSNGNRTQLTKRDGSVINYQYDALNRMTVKDIPFRADLSSYLRRDVHYTYNLQGLQTSARFWSSGSGGRIDYTFDGFGRLLSESSSDSGGVTRVVSSQYDKNGNRTRMTFPDNAFASFTHDGLNRLDRIKQGNSELGGMAYNERGLASELSWPVSTSSANARTYGYDHAGRVNQIGIDLHNTSNDVTWDYTRNPASQIRSEAQSNDTYSWDGQVNVDRAYVTNGLNQYTSAGGSNFTYDDNGNLTSDGTNNYLYDVENRLVRRTVGGITTTLQYDPTGRLIRIDDTTTGRTDFAYDGNALIAEYDASGTLLRRYVHGSNVEADDPLLVYERFSNGNGYHRRYLHTDPRGSVIALTNWRGEPYRVNSYDEYGIPDTASGDDIATKGRFRYTGQAWIPELGMYYYKARIYSPTLGRFLQTDPIGYEDQFNLYAYVGNDPINGIDPTGLEKMGEWDECNGHWMCEDARRPLGFGGGSEDSSEGNAANPPRNQSRRGVGQGPRSANNAQAFQNASNGIREVSPQHYATASSPGSTPSTQAVNVRFAQLHSLRQDAAANIRAHGYPKHVVRQGEFGNISPARYEAIAYQTIANRSEFKVITNPHNGHRRGVFWHQGNGTVAIVHYSRPSQSTMFRPTDGYAYFQSLK